MRPGTTTVALARQYPSAAIVAVDQSPSLLTVAADRLRAQNHEALLVSADFTGFEGSLPTSTWPLRRSASTTPPTPSPRGVARAAQPVSGQQIVTAPCVLFMTAAPAGMREWSVPVGQYANEGSARRPSRSHDWICSTIAAAAISPSRP